MLKLAKNNKNHNSFLNAGRGNPNWINTQARLAFARFVVFGAKESERTMLEGNLAGYTTLDGIGDRLNKNHLRIYVLGHVSISKLCFY